MDQLIRIGDGNVPVWATYHEDECGPFVITELQLVGTPGKPGASIFDCFTGDELVAMAEKLYAGHDRAVSQLNSMFRADRAADRAAFEEAYA
jgi:hypothetical protein